MKWMILGALILSVAAAKECRDEIDNCSMYKGICRMKMFEEYLRKNCARFCGFCYGSTAAPTTTVGHTNPPYTGKCGQPEIKGIRIVAGKDAVRGSWPWQILLIYEGSPKCGGTLIAPNWVVTAAHCVFERETFPQRYTVRVGEYDTTVTEGTEVDIQVEKIYRNPAYSRSTKDGDIALLKLSRPAKFNKYVSPACLPSAKVPVGSKCYITGWGKQYYRGSMTHILQQGVLPVVSNKVCYEKNKHIIPVYVTQGMICGGSGGTSRLSGCHGDSGGPYVCNINGKWELHGSVSYGSPRCNSTETYTVFARTYHYLAWARKVMVHD